MKQSPLNAPPREPSNGTSTQTTSGVVQRVDLVNRELEVRVSSETLLFDVPTDCLVVLHGEPIKLRLVQKGDQVAIMYVRRPDSLRIRRLEVQPGWPPVSMA